MPENPVILEAEGMSPATSPAISRTQPAPRSSAETVSDAAADSPWRDQLSARLDRYRARRKIRPPRYPSLRLRFDAGDSFVSHETQSAASSAPALEAALDQALTPDGLTDGLTPARSGDAGSQLRPELESAPQTVLPPAPHSGAKIIEFPRFSVERVSTERFNFEPPPPPPGQLAEPVGDRIRILEAPEVAPPAPALGGITIAPAPHQEAEKRPGIDIPLESASLGRRILASLVDGLIVTAASGLSGFIFWKVAAIRPPMVQMLGFAAGVPCLFWVVFQYLLIVYAGRTPGLRAAGLELARFDGKPASRSLRRWRVLASYLSAASLGMGYAWVFLDEDVLCWHDRITHTYLAPRSRHTSSVRVP